MLDFRAPVWDYPMKIKVFIHSMGHSPRQRNQSLSKCRSRECPANGPRQGNHVSTSLHKCRTGGHPTDGPRLVGKRNYNQIP